MTASVHRHLRWVACALIALGATVRPAEAAATIVIINNDAAGEGFNDPTPAAPVGGNTGTTLGQQRLIAFQHAASIWAAQLTSVPTINVLANFDPLTCTATSAVLGSAGPTSVWFAPAFPFVNTWYHAALANKLAGSDLLPPPDPSAAEIRARFNVSLGTTGCLTGVPFYLGLDNAHGTAIDLVAVVLHELGHGLGFSTTTSGTTGAFFGPPSFPGLPSAYDHFLFDTTQSLGWTSMTDAQRVASAINARRLVWTGAQVTAGVPLVLQPGTPELFALAPASVGGTYSVGAAAFGPPLTSAGVTEQVMPVVDSAGGIGLACTPLNAANAAAVNGKIALIDRGTCGFTVKVKNAQDAGAIAAIIADNVAGSPPPGLGGTDPTITISSVRITQADGAKLKNALRSRSRTRSGVLVLLSLNLATRAGADALDRALLFTPNPFQGGSSVSHWDTIAFPNQLMEPSINGDLTHSVMEPQDLTLRLLKDLGW